MLNRSTSRFLSLVVVSAFVSLWPLVAQAQPAPMVAITVDEARQAFLAQGYQLDTPMTWWTNNHVTTFTVSDRSGQRSGTGRVLMVLVYPDTATARDEIVRAQAGETSDTTQFLTAATAPHLIPGYGPGVLRGNVALVESTQLELAERYAAQLDRDNLPSSGTSEPMEVTPGPAAYSVDDDFLNALDNGIVNL
jgi:hypothetical protein